MTEPDVQALIDEADTIARDCRIIYILLDDADKIPTSRGSLPKASDLILAQRAEIARLTAVVIGQEAADATAQTPLGRQIKLRLAEVIAENKRLTSAAEDMRERAAKVAREVRIRLEAAPRKRKYLNAIDEHAACIGDGIAAAIRALPVAQEGK